LTCELYVTISERTPSRNSSDWSRMTSLVLELEQQAHDSSASLSNILRKAKAVAVKLHLKQPVAWVEAELNGYSGKDVPKYRKISGRVKAHNPYVGLIPMVCPNPEIERIISEHWVRESVASIEHMLASQGEPMVPLTGAKAQFLARHGSVPEFQTYLMISPTALAAILDAVRNKVLDWSLALQADGILGEGISFRREEKATVTGKGDTYNIGSIGNFAGNLGGSVGGNVTGTANQNIGQELEKVADLMRQLRRHVGDAGLGAKDQAKVSRKVEAIEEELRGASPKPGVVMGMLKSIKATMEGAGGSLVASGVISAISKINL
jgi:hypothetical protein